MAFDGEAFGQQMAETVRDYVAAALGPLRAENEALRARITVLEERGQAVPEKGERGEPGEPGQPGRDADPEETRALVQREVAAAVAALPPPERGEKGEPGESGQPGRNADPEETRALVQREVAAAVAALPPPERGEKGDVGERGEPGPQGHAGEPGRDGVDGKDGVGLADALINREGALVLTMTDGRMKDLGVIVGRDGADGAPGEPGRDGQDGRDLESLEVTQSGATIELAFQIGETRSIYEIELPAGPAGADGKDAYPGQALGLFDPKREYRALDVVSLNGSEWRAKHDNPGELPGPGWMLSASRGKRGEKGEPGEAGRAGAELVAAYVRDGELVLLCEGGTEIKVDLGGLHRAIEEGTN